MSDGNTMVSNVMVGHGANAQVAVKQEPFISAEDEALAREEDKLMDEEVSSVEDGAAEKVEQQMLTVALVKSVVETSATPTHKVTTDPDPDCKQRYSLRKRRRPTGEALDKLESLQCSKTRSDHLARTAATPSTITTRPPDQSSTSTNSQPVQVKTELTTAAPAPVPKPPPPQPHRSAPVPACTVAVSTPLPPPVPACTVSIPAPLLPPMQPSVSAGGRSPAKAKPKPKAKPRAAGAASGDTPKPRLRIPVVTAPLAPETARTAVPNPLSNPGPRATPAAVPPNAQPAFTAGTKLTVPCPLPSSTFESNAAANQSQPPQLGPAPSHVAPPPAPQSSEPAVEKKRVTIDPALPEASSRGRVFSIDLDPSSLDFSILDTGDTSSVPGRERAFSFECFAFGINAEEPLPPGASEAPPIRPRGESIIFDPTSFHDGGIHEEHALTTRETRALSVDIDPADILPPPAQRGVHPGSPRPAVPPVTYVPLPAVSSGTVPSAPAVSITTTRRLEPMKEKTYALAPDRAPSTHVVRTVPGPSPLPPPPPPSRPPLSRAPPVPQPHHRHPGAPMHTIPSNIGVPSSTLPPNTAPSNLTSTGAIAPVGAAATTFQMELLNKDGRIGIYLPDARRERIARFHAKRKMRIWRKRIKYDCRKKLADSRPRIKGRFVKRSDMD